MQIKEYYFKIKFLIEYISPLYKKQFLLLNIRIIINFQSRCVVRNSNKKKLIRSNHVQCLQKHEKYCHNIPCCNKYVRNTT